MIETFHRHALQNRVCELLKREYIALLAQRGSGLQTFVDILLDESPPIAGMRFISISLPSVKWGEDEFNHLLLERLISAIATAPPEGTLLSEVQQMIQGFEARSAAFKLGIALDTLGMKTTAAPLVIVLQSLAQAPEGPLRNLLLMLRDYHSQRNQQNQPGRRLRFLATGDLLLWRLCSQQTEVSSPFNIARRVFLEGLSFSELAEFDQSGDNEASMRMRNLTDGIPALVKKALEMPHNSDDLSPFFELLENYWDSLPEASRLALKSLTEGTDNAPKSDPDSQCQPIPKEIKSPWLEAFWKGFLRFDHRELIWRSPIHRAFVMDRMQVRGDTSKSTLVKVDLLERSLRLEKILKQKQDDESKDKYLAEAFSLAVQTHDAILAPILQSALNGEDKTAVLEKLNQVATQSDKGWVKDLEEKATADKESITGLLINAAMWESRRLLGDFDVFLCHHTIDKPLVKEMAEKLLEQGILPWLDEWELRPGLPWQDLLEQQIGQIKTAAVFVGKDGIGPWQHMEIQALLREFVKRRCPVIPVLLPEALSEPELPIFLKGMTWVDFRKRDPDPLERLIWGITGKRDHIM